MHNDEHKQKHPGRWFDNKEIRNKGQFFQPGIVVGSSTFSSKT